MEQPAKPKRRLPIIVIVVLAGGALLTCLVCVATGALGGKGTPTPAAVAVNAPAGEAAATAVPTPAPVGLSRSSPASAGVAVEADDHVVLTVTGMVRGQEAWGDIYQDNMFNSEPAEGKEYVLVTVEAQFKGGADETHTVSEFYFRLVGDQGTIYTQSMLTLEQDMTMELFGGGSGVGQVAFEVAEGEQGLVLIYSGAGTKARYLSVGG